MRKAKLFLWAGVLALFAAGTALTLGQTEVADFCLIMTGLLAFIGRELAKKNTRVHETYKGVKVVFTQERPGVWSSHFDGYPLSYWKAFWRSCLSLSGEPVRLLPNKRDRQNLEDFALDAFQCQLTLCQKTPRAVILSASVLNQAKRRSDRLIRRERIVQTHPGGWKYERINRNMSLFETLVGRILFRWKINKDYGETFFRAVAPGIVVWRSKDPKPSVVHSRGEDTEGSI